MIIIEITSPHDREFPCPKCDRTFRSRRVLGAHKRSHTIKKRREAENLVRELENTDFQGNAWSFGLGKAPMSEPELESETDVSDTEFNSKSDYDMKMARAYDCVLHSLRRSSDLSGNSSTGRDKKPRHENGNRRPSNDNGKGKMGVRSGLSKRMYKCPICDMKIRGAYALWAHVGNSHNNNNSGGSDSPSLSTEVLSIEGESDEEVSVKR